MQPKLDLHISLGGEIKKNMGLIICQQVGSEAFIQTEELKFNQKPNLYSSVILRAIWLHIY